MQDKFINRAIKDIDIISNEVSDFLYLEDVYQNRTKPAMVGGKNDWHVSNQITKAHYTSMLIALRRQLGLDKSEVSLMNLLTKLKNNCRLITKKWYVQEWHKDSNLLSNDEPDGVKRTIQAIPAGEFESFFGNEHLDPKIVEADISKLSIATIKIKAFVDSRIAHTDKKFPEVVSEQEYHKALDVIQEITKKYILLLKQVGMANMRPTIQD